MPHMRLARAVLHLLNVALLAIVGLRALTVWDRLPDLVPMHFNYAGEANRWAPRDAGFAVLFAIPWLITALLYAMRAGLGYFAKRPELANLPPRLRGMSAEQLAPFFESVRDTLLLAVTAANLALGTALYGTLQVALHLAERMPGWTTPQTWVPVLGAAVVLGVGRMLVVSARIGRGG